MGGNNMIEAKELDEIFTQYKIDQGLAKYPKHYHASRQKALQAIQTYIDTHYVSKQKWEELYSDENMGLKRTILMDLIGAVLETPRKQSSAEVWKLHIDAALDQLETAVYLPVLAVADPSKDTNGIGEQP